MATISLRDVRKSYGGSQVIHGVSVDIADGELIVIVGPSGCGKSTLLRMVAGLEVITAGEIAIGGRVVNALEPRERNIAMVFQNYALYPHMSVFGNMAYGLKIAGLPKAEIEARVRKAAAMLELTPFLERRPRQLSGGQRQRVAMGRAIVRSPAAFLFDEPLSNLDAKLRVQMRMEIKALQRELRTTSLYVTHDQIEAMTLADRMIVMNAGVAEQIGKPLEIYEDPATMFVAGFIGSPPMNFLAPGPGEAPEVHRIGVRPEHLRPVTPAAGFVAGRVRFNEPLGAETLVHVETPAGAATLRLDAGASIPAEGSEIGLACDSARIYRFDREGRRLRLGAAAGRVAATA
jgi:sn-glycerol 3-phosphate transport system ATP-binding protein